MNYSISNLTQAEDCNVLLAWAAKEKADLDFKRISDLRLTEKFASSSISLEATLQGVIAQIAANEISLAALPEGPARDEFVDRKIRLEYRKYVLETRKESYGTVALLEKEMDLGRILQELEEVEIFIEAVETKKATLPQSN